MLFDMAIDFSTMDTSQAIEDESTKHTSSPMSYRLSSKVNFPIINITLREIIFLKMLLQFDEIYELKNHNTRSLEKSNVHDHSLFNIILLL